MSSLLVSCIHYKGKWQNFKFSLREQRCCLVDAEDRVGGRDREVEMEFLEQSRRG